MSSQALAGVRNLNSLLQIPSIRPKTQVKRRKELENLIDRSPDREIRIPSLAWVSDSISESPDLSSFRSFLTRSKRFARRGNDFRSLAFFFFFPALMSFGICSAFSLNLSVWNGLRSSSILARMEIRIRVWCFFELRASVQLESYLNSRSWCVD